MNSFEFNKIKKPSMETLDVSFESIPKKAMSVSFAKRAGSHAKGRSNRSSNSSGLTHFDSDLFSDGKPQTYSDIEVEGENLFNSVAKPVAETSFVKGANAKKRFSTEEAKRLSIISMQQFNLNDDNKNLSNTKSISYDTPLPPDTLRTSASNNNFKSPSQHVMDSPVSEKSFSSPFFPRDLELEPHALRRRMSIKRRSAMNSVSPIQSSEMDSCVQYPTINGRAENTIVPFLAANTGSRANTPVSRRSSLLASGDVLSMKMGKLQRKCSVSSGYDHQRLNKSNDLTSVSSRCLESSLENEDIIPFTDASYKIQSNTNDSHSDIEMDPLDTRVISDTKKSYKDKKKFPDLDLKPINAYQSDEMNNIIKSIAENTRDQLRRSTVISANSQSSGNSYVDFKKPSSANNDAHNMLDFSFAKGNEDFNKKINLDEAGYSEKESTKSKQESKKNKKKTNYWFDMF